METPRRVPRGPFIMPDGTSLAAFMRAEEPVTRPKRSKPQAPSREWVSDWLTTSGSQPPSIPELDALQRIGQRRQRRWLNNRLLLALAGRLTAADIEGLFKPVPFGAPRPPTVWETLAEERYGALRESLRSLDPDTQADLLAIGGFLAQPGAGDELVFEGLDSFGRLLCHSLAEFHGLSSTSRADGLGAKAVVLRREGRGDHPAPSCTALLLMMQGGPGGSGTPDSQGFAANAEAGRSLVYRPAVLAA
ncbi:hypothetical protein F751_2352 [Auxenochlorella protothecoides]|uniref:R3H-associated N-terminal domain-containing protein n=1 Tax=Auxenochlorella protothecoides TaxID=3075 RepID=A0A087SFY0_AUXPR|nr:hypothetical protein F751_2352 [Auxenochlorella protothecoides]KFM24634.1 hypothetical protein F751_2352 [Auxenochlorella protothecoides]